jgi:putative transcriptional regulator
MIRIHLSRILGEKRWTQADLARKTGIRPNTISEIYNELIERINIDHLDIICEVLDCDVSDILEYVPNNKRKHAEHL